MRVLKENTGRYQTLLNHLKGSETISILNGSIDESADYLYRQAGVENLVSHPILNSDYSENLVSFNNELKIAANLSEVNIKINKKLKSIVGIKRCEIFLFDEEFSGIPAEPALRNPAETDKAEKKRLKPLNEKTEASIVNFINKAHNENKFSKIFHNNESELPVNKYLSLPVIIKKNDLDFARVKENFLVFPIKDGMNKKGILLLISSVPSLQIHDIDTIKTLLCFVMNRILSIKKKNELKSVYNELQVYQSKLSNDFKLSAIGEFTTGMTEDILSRLQLIISYSDLLRKEKNNPDNKHVDAVNKQVKEIETIIKRLIKFSEVNDVKPSIYPLNLNDSLKHFHELIISSLRNENYECILDLEDDIPSILTHHDYVNQLLTNIFSFLKSKISGSGGILIQSKFQKQNVDIRILTTDFIEELSSGRMPGNYLNFRIIQNIMNKHEGHLSVSSEKQSGTTILLSFPLNRSLKK